MAFTYNPNYTPYSGVLALLGEECVIQMQLTDALNVNVPIRVTSDSDVTTSKQLKWVVTERVAGGEAHEFTGPDNVSIISGLNSRVELKIPRGVLTSKHGYRHRVYAKWPQDSETQWKLAGQGIIVTCSLPEGRATV